MYKNNLDRTIPQIAKNENELSIIREKILERPTSHQIYIKDARDLTFIEDKSIHLVLTSPPYWNLKKYNNNINQLGHINNYINFLDEIDIVWEQCYKKLVEGGRMVVVVGDVLLSRRQYGRHKIMPLHADIQVRCEKIGFDNLAPIFWHKITNANFEVKGNTKFLGKPYEPNGIIKHDIEYLLMLRKPGGYRNPSEEQRILSIISEKEFNSWYKQIWALNGTSTKNHPAPFPEKLAIRLVKMFSFVGDTILDPFLGSGTTTVAAIKSGRNSIGFEIDSDYAKYSFNRAKKEISLFTNSNIKIELEEKNEKHSS
ncbi:site-specific DNA-methyltransferase [candidate division KSB1 bacterium]|nr:site-specific DNA-methyltransferase [candidate division KSB1 bacterium]